MLIVNVSNLEVSVDDVFLFASDDESQYISVVNYLQIFIFIRLQYTNLMEKKVK